MILDSQTLFSENQAITADAPSTNVLDLGAPRNIGPGVPVPLLVQVTEDFDNLTDLRVAIQTDSDEAFSAPVTVVEASLPLAKLTAGARFPFLVMPEIGGRYVRLFYDVTGTAPTAGRVTAGIVWGLQTNI